MDRLNSATVTLFTGLFFLSFASAQVDDTVVKRFESPAALIVVYLDPTPTLQGAEEKLAKLHADYPDKLILRAALYQSLADAKEVEEHGVMGHTNFRGWRTEYRKQRAIASRLAEAVQVGAYGIARSYNAGKIDTQKIEGLLPLDEISCGESKMRFVYLAGGQIGPDSVNFIQLYFQWTGNTTQLDAECLANKLNLTELSPVDLSLESNPLFYLDTRYPRFNRFLQPAYDEADRLAEEPKRTAPDYACLSIVKRPNPYCVTVPAPNINS